MIRYQVSKNAAALLKAGLVDFIREKKYIFVMNLL